MNLKHTIAAFIVFISYTAMPLFAHAAGSSYAVFKVSYSDTNKPVVGGVSGTAFFVSQNKAMTACHVLNEKSFEPAPGFTKSRLWLVHENQKAIELFKSNVVTNCDRDETIIHFKQPVVASKFVFSTQTEGFSSNSEFTTEGFIANTAGPEFAWENGQLEITSVPSLQRVTTKGTLIRNVKVDLKATDVTLVNTNSIQVSYKPIVGMSGGPVLINGKIVAFNSFADPETRNSTWAVLLN